jgi:oxygen-independent coproporphyrinogen-3 oxidase
MDAITDELTLAAGLLRYEIANLARKGYESRHNQLYWHRRPYIGLGPGAHSFDGARERRWNGPRLDGYIGALSPDAPASAPTLPAGGSEVVDVATARAELAILGLRLSEGLSASIAEDPLVAPALRSAGAEGLVESSDGRVRLTTRGRALSNEVFVRLLPDVRKDDGAGRAGRDSAG